MHITVVDSTRAALLKDRTLRCIYRTKYKEELRWSTHVISWAQSCTEDLCQSIVEVVFQGRHQDRQDNEGEDSKVEKEDKEGNEGQEGQDGQEYQTDRIELPRFTVQLIMVKLPGVSQRITICFDLFLDDCNPDLRQKFDQSLRQPIHLANHQRGYGLMIGRAVPLDARVADEYRARRERDKGPRPLYSDLLNVPLFREGLRVPDEERARLLRSPIVHSETEQRPGYIAGMDTNRNQNQPEMEKE